MTQNNDAQKMIRRELEGVPVITSFGNGAKHPYVELTANGRTERIYFCGNIRTPRALLNVRADLRRKLRALSAPEKAGA